MIIGRRRKVMGLYIAVDVRVVRCNSEASCFSLFEIVEGEILANFFLLTSSMFSESLLFLPL